MTGHWEKVRPGQAGRRIVDEAREIEARAIVMPRPRKRPGTSLFGRTLETVLEERPCRVIIESEPLVDERIIPACTAPIASRPASLGRGDLRPGGGDDRHHARARRRRARARRSSWGCAFVVLGAGRLYLAGDR